MNERGSLMLETVIVLPLLLMLVFACIQFSEIWIARQAVQYSAFCAARSMLVTNPSELVANQPNQPVQKNAAMQAAAQVCAWVALDQDDDVRDIVPGWGASSPSLSTLGKLVSKNHLDVTTEESGFLAKATVRFDFPLRMPIVGSAIAWGINPYPDPESGREAWEYDGQTVDGAGNEYNPDAPSPAYPYIRFTETVLMSKPYKTMTSSQMQPCVLGAQP